jgi:hypothetical protein
MRVFSALVGLSCSIQTNVCLNHPATQGGRKTALTVVRSRIADQAQPPQRFEDRSLHLEDRLEYTRLTAKTLAEVRNTLTVSLPLTG